jgi:hypothetical protein
MDINDNTNPPKQSIGDVGHTAAKAVLSMIPVVGGPAAELFSALIMPPLVKRRDEWIQSIAQGLQELQEQVTGFTIDSLQGNEAFVTATMHATQVAIRNHHAEKREALRNAVLNVASGNAPDDDIQLIFLDLVDTLTPWHLRFLHFFHDPSSYIASRGPNKAGGGISHTAIMQIVESTFPELQTQRPFAEQIVKHLYDRGLITIDSHSLHGPVRTTLS